MKILLVDNYDSFTYNLVQMLEEIIDQKVIIVKNDQLHQLDFTEFDAIILSPGPGIPIEAGGLMQVIKMQSAHLPILGVCLGHQAFGEVFDAELAQLTQVHHGISSKLKLCASEPIYKNLQQPIQVGRYHSWIVSDKNLPEQLIVTARDQEGHIMSMRHKHLPITSVQFHPESILTPQGKQMLTNWINSIRK